MKKLRYITIIIGLALIPTLTFSQSVSFSSIIKGATDPASGFLQEELKKGKFTQVSAYKSRFKPEAWAYAYNPANGAAGAWVNSYFNPKVLEKKNRRTAVVELNIRTFGIKNQYHARLVNDIKETCKYGGTSTSETEGYIYKEYAHESGALIQIYSINEENFIKIRHTALLKKE